MKKLFSGVIILLVSFVILKAQDFNINEKNEIKIPEVNSPKIEPVEENETVSKIVGGVDAYNSEFPFIVSL